MRGWFSNVPPNGFQNRPKTLESNNNEQGVATPEPDIAIETTPELELVAPNEIDRAAELFYRDGFVAVRVRPR